MSSVLKEYITPEQKAKLLSGGAKLLPYAKKRTDHIFGGKNEVEYPLHQATQTVKSDTHKAVENYLDKKLTTDEYNTGLTTDKYGRQAKIGRLLNGHPELQNKFSQDPERAARKSTQQGFTVRLVRGLEVAGQTNPEPDTFHPKGHSWAQQSCKNITDGEFRHVLPHEIAHGTVVGFVKDHTGKEIYRGTLQPRMSRDSKHGYIYTLEDEYGVVHPSFTNELLGVAEKLSLPRNPAKPFELYDAYDDLYYQHGIPAIHPSIKERELGKMLSHPDPDVQQAVVIHPNVTDKIREKALDHENNWVGMMAAADTRASEDLLTKASKHHDPSIRIEAAQNPKTPKHVVIGLLSDPEPTVRGTALTTSKVPRELAIEFLHKPNETERVKASAASNPNLTLEDLHNAVGSVDKSKFLAAHVALVRHKRADDTLFDKVLDSGVTQRHLTEIAMHPNAGPSTLTKILSFPNANDRALSFALENKNSNAEVALAGLRHPSVEVRLKALNHKSLEDTWHIERLAHDSSQPRVVREAARAKLATKRDI